MKLAGSRAVRHGKLADRLLDDRAAARALTLGAYVYSSPSVWNGRVYIGSLHRDLLLPLGLERVRSSGRSRQPAPSAAPSTIVDGIVYFANRQHRIYGVNARTGRQVFRFPDGAFVPVSGNGSPPAPARLLAALRGRARGRRMKRALIRAGWAVVLAVAAGLVAYALYKKHEGRDVRGSSSVEFVTTQAKLPPKLPAKVLWPTYRYDAARNGAPQGIPEADPAAVRGALVLPRPGAGRVPASRSPTDGSTSWNAEREAVWRSTRSCTAAVWQRCARLGRDRAGEGR